MRAPPKVAGMLQVAWRSVSVPQLPPRHYPLCASPSRGAHFPGKVRRLGPQAMTMSSPPPSQGPSPAMVCLADAAAALILAVLLATPVRCTPLEAAPRAERCVGGHASRVTALPHAQNQASGPGESIH